MQERLLEAYRKRSYKQKYFARMEDLRKSGHSVGPRTRYPDGHQNAIIYVNQINQSDLLLALARERREVYAAAQHHDLDEIFSDFRMRQASRVQKQPENPKEYLASLAVAAKEGMDAVSRALARGDLTVDKGDIHLPKLEKEDVPPPVAQARDAISTHIGTIQLPELLMEMDVQTRFSKTLLARVPRSEHELLLTYGALLGHGTEMNATEVALMIPSLTAPEISAAMKSLEAHGSIDKANKLITEFVDRLPVMKVWGDGKSASSDMMSLQASMHLWNARRDPRRKTASMGMYTHVSNQWPIIYHQPIVLGNRQVGAAIEGVVRQERIDLDWLAVDTHGYTDVGMCIARMQTFDLCPQLANLRERRLTVPKGMKIPEALASVVDATLHVECIQERWDDLLRIAVLHQQRHRECSTGRRTIWFSGAG